MDYESKKRVLGIKNDGYDTEGYEYYIDGIFEIGEPDTKDNGVSTNEIEMYSPYVESFDWRNRHGINWMTSCKDQGQSGYCVAFAITGALEAISNIYYNNKIDLDLSEQDIVYTYAKQHFIDTISEYYKKGMLEPTALQGVKSVGVVDEMSVPFIDSPNITVSPQRGDYKECLFFNRYDDVNYYQQINNIKYDLINFGPMVGGINAGETRHAMTLVGYHKIKVGDTITNVTTEYEGAGIIREGDRRIGQTYWVFKNSYGENFGRRGYMYVLFADMSKMSKPYYIMTPLQSEQYSDNDIICSDKDGDGYYFWGFGTKPSHLPKWIPKSRDGDDSNAKYGPMNSYGQLQDLNPDKKDTIYITESVDWNEENYVWQHVVIKDGGLLNITSNIKCYKGVELRIENGGKLVVDGGKLENSNIYAEPNSELHIKNKGKINSNKYISIAKGARTKIDNGIIQ